MPWDKRFVRHKDASFGVPEYVVDSDDLVDSKLRHLPEFKSVKTCDTQIFGIETSTYRLVFASDPATNADFNNLMTESDYQGLEFKAYGLNGKEGECCFLSKELNASEIINLVKTSHPCTLLDEICILNIKKADTRDYSKFSDAMTAGFKHEDRIFDPFKEFVIAVADMDPDLILARLFHLAQSSGTGKTMLCLHLIKKLKKGIYNVFRPDGSIGYPPSTDWTLVLINQFKSTQSEGEAVKLCLAFILAAVETFYDIPDDFDVFEYYAAQKKVFSSQFKDNFENARKLTDSQLLQSLKGCTSKIGECFPIILDECHEFLCNAYERSNNGITLYRAFRRAMVKIKNLKIVVICLGTKSSLSDFVLNYRMDASARPGVAIMPINPYTFVQSFDVFVEPGDDRAVFHSTSILKKMTKVQVLFRTN